MREYRLDENFIVSDTLALRKSPSFAAMNRYNEMVEGQASAANRKEREHNKVSEEAQASTRGQHIFSIGLSLAASLTSGAIFLVALINKFALVEIAASLCTALQVFFFSSAIADLVERENISRRRNSWVVVLAVLLIAFYSFTWYFP
jgi:hypothetical protein